MDLLTLADLPELPGSDPQPTSRIVVARLDDKLSDPRYGTFAITQAMVDSWKRNLSEVFGGEVAIDADHSSDRGQGTKAAAWIGDLQQDGDLVTAAVGWTPWGASLVRNREYRYISPTFVGDFKDEHGKSHGPALIGAGLTNRPVLRKGMPTLSLSRDDAAGVGVEEEVHNARELARRALHAFQEPKRDLPPDSRRQMNPELAKLLGLPDDADDKTLLSAVTDLKAKADKPPEPAKVPEPAPGTMTLSADQVATLIADANAGKAAAVQLAEQTFTVAWDKALSEGRAAPSQEATMRELHKLNPELAVKTLDSFVKVVPTKPAGSGTGGPAAEAPDGFDQDRYDLHAQAKQLAADKVKADPTLDAGEAYMLAAHEIEDRRMAAEEAI